MWVEEAILLESDSSLTPSERKEKFQTLKSNLQANNQSPGEEENRPRQGEPNQPSALSSLLGQLRSQSPPTIQYYPAPITISPNTINPPSLAPSYAIPSPSESTTSPAEKQIPAISPISNSNDSLNSPQAQSWNARKAIYKPNQEKTRFIKPTNREELKSKINKAKTTEPQTNYQIIGASVLVFVGLLLSNLFLIYLQFKKNTFSKKDK
nr:hypothetical protein [Morchella crassipes]